MNSDVVVVAVGFGSTTVGLNDEFSVVGSVAGIALEDAVVVREAVVVVVRRVVVVVVGVGRAFTTNPDDALCVPCWVACTAESLCPPVLKDAWKVIANVPCLVGVAEPTDRPSTDTYT